MAGCKLLLAAPMFRSMIATFRAYSAIMVVMLTCNAWKHVAADSLNIMIPTYIYPTNTTSTMCGDSSYISLSNAGSVVTAIVNPNNGPVSSNSSSSYFSV